MTDTTTNEVAISKKLQENIDWLNDEMSIAENFDVICREFTFAGRDAALIFIDGFAKDQIIMYLMRSLSFLKREDLAPRPFNKVFKQYLNYTEVTILSTLQGLVNSVLAGPIALLIDGEDNALLIDAREYPVRSPDEPDLERVVRGPRDGFTETLVFNTALVRRRIRDPNLRMELVQAGTRSKTDICISYIHDIANPTLVKDIKRRISEINIDGLPMADKSVVELIDPGSIWNPFPKVRYTERADVAAAHLLEGHILLLVDTSPSIIILPATYFHHLQHAEEYRQTPATGVFMRFVRYSAVLVSIFLLPLWLLFSLQPELLPPQLSFIGPTKAGKIGLMYQFLLAELGINMMRMAAIHTPTSLATALGLIAALLIGQVAIDVGLFSPEVVLYTAVAAVGVFATPSYEMGLANNLVRVVLLVAVGFFRLPGLILATALVFLYLASTRSFGVSYLWPLLPYNARGLWGSLWRTPIPMSIYRPALTHPQDRQRQLQPAAKPLRRDHNRQERQRREK